MSEIPLFRASKRRKTTQRLIRRPSEDNDNDNDNETDTTARDVPTLTDQASQVQVQPQESGSTSTPEIRSTTAIHGKFRPHRSSGISFSNVALSSHRNHDDTVNAQSEDVKSKGALVSNGGSGSSGHSTGLSSRFVGSGMGGAGSSLTSGRDGFREDDENIMAHIDAEMARRRELERQMMSASRSPTTYNYVEREQESTSKTSEHPTSVRTKPRTPASIEGHDIQPQGNPNDPEAHENVPGDKNDDVDENSQAKTQALQQPNHPFHQQRQAHQSHTFSPNQIPEIDLSVSLLTSQAQTAQTSSSKEPRKKRPRIRIGRDGKPYRVQPRPRKARDEEDVKREELVEQVLMEGGLGFGYTKTDGNQGNSRGGHAGGGGGGGGGGGENGSKGDGRGQENSNVNDADADERMEREFLREFMERAVERSGYGGRGAKGSGMGASKDGAGGNGSGSGSGAGVNAGTGALPSGPRLGGSRSARARMVAALEKEREREKLKER